MQLFYQHYVIVAQASAGRAKENASRGLKVLIAGLVLGLALATTGAQLLSQQVESITPGAYVFVSVAVALICGGLFACCLPAKRVTVVNPSETLRLD